MMMMLKEKRRMRTADDEEAETIITSGVAALRLNVQLNMSNTFSETRRSMMDREEQVQTEFAIWIQSHPEAETQFGGLSFGPQFNQPPSLILGDGQSDVKVGLGDLTWLINLPSSYGGKARKKFRRAKQTQVNPLLATETNPGITSFEVQVAGPRNVAFTSLNVAPSHPHVEQILVELLGVDASTNQAQQLEAPLADCMWGVVGADDLPQLLDCLLLFSRHFRKHELAVRELQQSWSYGEQRVYVDPEQRVWDEYVASTLTAAVHIHEHYNMRVARGEEMAMAEEARESNFLLRFIHGVETVSMTCDVARQAVLEAGKAVALMLCEIFKEYELVGQLSMMMLDVVQLEEEYESSCFSPRDSSQHGDDSGYEFVEFKDKEESSSDDWEVLEMRDGVLDIAKLTLENEINSSSQVESDEVHSQIHIPMAESGQEDREDSEEAGESMKINSATGLLQSVESSEPELYRWWGHLDWGLLQKAIHSGDVLQWCSVTLRQAKQSGCCVVCTLEVGEFIENDESACLIGLLPHTPLHIEIQLNTESKFPLVRGVTAFQEVLGAVQPPVPVKFGLRCYIPHLVNHYFANNIQGSTSRRWPAGPHEDFVGLMKHLVACLSQLCKICCSCLKSLNQTSSEGVHIGICNAPSCRFTLGLWMQVSPPVCFNYLAYKTWITAKYGPRERPNHAEIRHALHMVHNFDKSMSSNPNFDEFVHLLVRFLLIREGRLTPLIQILSDNRWTVCAPLNRVRFVEPEGYGACLWPGIGGAVHLGLHRFDQTTRYLNPLELADQRDSNPYGYGCASSPPPLELADQRDSNPYGYGCASSPAPFSPLGVMTLAQFLERTGSCVNAPSDSSDVIRWQF